MNDHSETGMLYGALEAGGTKFVCEVCDHAGVVLAATRIPTTRPQSTLAAVADFFAAQIAGGKRYAGIGIATFGPVDLHTQSPTYGHILATPKPGWSHTDLVAPLARRFGCGIAIDTDVNAAALAETLQGAGRGCSTVVYVTVGTGIGGGICSGGRSLQGALHPEMGHIRVLRHPLDDEFSGSCPFHGDCLEGLASGTAIVARYGVGLDELPAGHAAYAVLGHYLGQLAVAVILLLSPHRVIFGGGVMQNAALLDHIRATTASLMNGYAGLGTAAALDKLIVAPGLGERAGISGAFALARAAPG